MLGSAATAGIGKPPWMASVGATIRAQGKTTTCKHSQVLGGRTDAESRQPASQEEEDEQGDAGHNEAQPQTTGRSGWCAFTSGCCQVCLQLAVLFISDLLLLHVGGFACDVHVAGYTSQRWKDSL